MNSRQFILLDRDGTINVDQHYLSDPDQLELLPGVSPGLDLLRRAGFGLIVITNQSGIARGYFDELRLMQIHDRLRDMLMADGIAIDAIYHCPHGPADNCRCRKPAPGMIELAARDFGFDPSACVVIGDKPCDIELGHAAGATTMLVRTGYGSRYAAEYEADAARTTAQVRRAAPHAIADNLVDAAGWIIDQCSRVRTTAAKVRAA